MFDNPINDASRTEPEEEEEVQALTGEVLDDESLASSHTKQTSLNVDNSDNNSSEAASDASTTTDANTALAVGLTTAALVAGVGGLRVARNRRMKM